MNKHVIKQTELLFYTFPYRLLYSLMPSWWCVGAHGHHLHSDDDVICHLVTEEAILWYSKWPTSLPAICMLGVPVLFGMWCHGAQHMPTHILKTWNNELALEQNDTCLLQPINLMKLIRNQRHQKICYAHSQYKSTKK